MSTPPDLRGIGETLVLQGMPVDEVRTVLRANDPASVRRHLELHRERLIEQHDEARRAVDRLERLLLERSDPRRGAVGRRGR